MFITELTSVTAPSAGSLRIEVNRTDIKQACSYLKTGGIVAYPTESCYGLGCDPRNNKAIKSLLEIKHRPWHKGLILIASSVDQLYPFIDRKQFDMDKVQASWPGPTTWVVPAAEGISHYLRGNHQGIAVRVTDHPLASLLCRTFRGPIVSTSANPGRYPPALSAKGVRRYFAEGEVEMILEGPLGELESPTPIYDAVSGNTLRK